MTDKNKLEIMDTGCIYINDFRVCGSKPLGMQKVIKTFVISDKDLKDAMNNKNKSE